MTEQILIPKIDPKVFRYPRTTTIPENKAFNVLKETTIMPIITGAKAWPDIPQGIELYYQNIPFPRKGFPDADIINALNNIKKDTIHLIRLFAHRQTLPFLVLFVCYPYSKKIKLIDAILTVYLEKCYYWLDFWLYKRQYYCPFANEIWILTVNFFKEMGIKSPERLAEICTNLVEHDDAYRVRPQDLFTECNFEELYNHPHEELRRLYELYKQREHGLKTMETNSMIEKFGSAFKLLDIALYHPKIKRAFRKALKAVDYQKLRFDEGDKYWAYGWGNYDAMGLSFEERQKIRIEIHKDIPPTPFAKVKYD